MCQGLPSRDSLNRFFNRELSWLRFNRRVLAEAANFENPALERLKYLSITASNLDEFFMVRFAYLRAQTLAGVKDTDPSGLTPQEQLVLVAQDAHRFMQEQLSVWETCVLPDISHAGLRPLLVESLDTRQLAWLERRLRKDIQPQLTLLAEDGQAGWPPVPGRQLLLALLLAGEKSKKPQLVLVLPSPALPRTWKPPKAGGFVLLEQIVAHFAARLVPSRRVLGCWACRITRDADFTVSDAATGDLLQEMEKSLRRRKTGDVVRLEVDARAPRPCIRRLMRAFCVPEEAVVLLDGPLNLTFLLKELYGTEGLDSLRYAPFTSRMPARLQGCPVMDAMQEGDIFLHHPYDSFGAVLRFVEEAAADPRVLSIKQTLYRVSGKSPVIRALCSAAEAGKRVTVLLEVKARFDEENNIRWGKLLEKAGCRVIYGVPSVKTHSKITLVARREGDGVRRYMHLGTGNYNDVTARQYTDMGLLTCDPVLGEDAAAFFNLITGFSRNPRMEKMVYAPKMLRSSLLSLIRTETENARAGLPCGISAKMNSLVDPEIIDVLYDASCAGVPVLLIVRGICCLRPGVPGLSQQIRVRSIVGRFLEHSRVFRFENGGDPRLYLSSADWMPRNLNRRLELMFPVEDAGARAQVEHVLDMQWKDEAKAWEMGPDGEYARVPRGAVALNAQEALFSQETAAD